MNLRNADTVTAVPSALARGLSIPEASQRLIEHGANELPAENRRSVFAMAFSVIREPMFLLLLACASVHWLLGEPRKAMMLAAAIVFMMVITLVQEQRTENALAALRAMSAPAVIVIRDGEQLRIPSREVVPGDLVLVREGDRVAADGILISGSNVTADESLRNAQFGAQFLCEFHRNELVRTLDQRFQFRVGNFFQVRHLHPFGTGHVWRRNEPAAIRHR